MFIHVRGVKVFNMMMIENKYNIGDIVYLKTDVEQMERIIIAMEINSGGLLYRLSCGENDTYHYAIEMAVEKSFIASSMS